MMLSQPLSANVYRNFKANKLFQIKSVYFYSCAVRLIVAIAAAGILPIFVSAANTSPKADAGKNKVVISPSTSTTLSGTGSDVEGAVTFRWTQVRGASTALIAKPTSAITALSNLKLGVYIFKLTVTDNGGLSRTDTVAVSVFEKLTWTINGVKREALVHPSSVAGAAPVLFAFHGHGGKDSVYAEQAFDGSWPEAIMVYPQGLRTKTPLDSNCKMSGWQGLLGEINCLSGIKDQDVIFFDTILNTLKRKYKVNAKLVFVHGWSNGGDYIVNALWAVRRSKIAALAPTGGNMDTTLGKSAIPLIQPAGLRDEKIAFTEQQHDNQEVRKLNKCSTTGTTWASGAGGLLGTKYASTVGNNPVVFLQYDGTHVFPPTIPPLIVKFFKEVAASITATKSATLITRVTPPLPMESSLSAK